MNEKKKSAMQILHNEVICLIKNCSGVEDGDPDAVRVLSTFKERIEKLRETEEKEQLIYFFDSGFSTGLTDEGSPSYLTGEKLYNETYGE